jgi:hypothetical protein
MSLIYSSDYENLPTDPRLRWLKLHDLVERKIEEVTDHSGDVSNQYLVEYCTVLTTAANEAGFANFDEVSASNIRRDYETIRSNIIALATKLNMSISSANAAYSVALSRSSKTKIFAQIEKLRSLILGSDLQDSEKERLTKKLDELHILVVSPRVDYAKVMSVLSICAAAIIGTTSVLADGPAAIATITAIIGVEKEAEEEEEEQKLIEVERVPLKIADLRGNGPDNTEIPF